MAIRDLHPLKGEREFRWRGAQPTRVEALSDMVFAFALTLLVVSNAPPASFGELTELLWGFPGFAAAFAMLLMIWNMHYIFFRRYALEDGWTTTLNSGLLFLILFFVYPLKYLATMLSAFVRSVIEGAPQAPLSLYDAQSSLIMLSAAYAAVFLMFLALYRHALKKADELDLSQRERQLTRFACWQNGVHAAVGIGAAGGAWLIPLPWSPFAGFIYFFIGPLILLGGLIFVPAAKRQPATDPQ
ncbi:MAG: TMEM175 family protein [Hyphomonadaceae bacterium]